MSGDHHDHGSMALTEQERRRLAAQIARMGIWEWNLETGELFADEAVRELGRQHAGQHWNGPIEFAQRFLPQDRDKLESVIRDAIASNTPCHVVARMPLPDGSLRWLSLYAQRLYANGQPSPWLAGVVMDVSAQSRAEQDSKRKERELEEQRLRLDLALQASRLGLWDYELERKLLYVDDRYAEITGIDREALAREPLALDLRIHEEDRPRYLAANAQYLSGRASTLRFEGRLLRPDGRLIWISIEGLVAQQKADGTPARLIGTVADVTARRRSEQLLRVGEWVGRSGSYEYDIGSDHFRWSEGTYRLFELPPDFVPARGSTLQLLTPQSRDLEIETFRRACNEGREFDLEIEARTAGGRKIWLRDTGRVESFQGRPVRIYGIVQDITQRKKLEAALLEAANREQQRLGRELHDGLGQELTGISLLMQGIAQQVQGANPALTPTWERLSSLMSSAIRSTRTLAHGLAPVSPSLGGLEGALRRLAEQSQVAYGIEVDLDLDLAVPLALSEVGASDLYRIAQEALNNAIRHAQPSRVDLRLAATAGRIELDVRDDGVGIDDDASAHGGMGLQSMAYRVQNLHGTLSVRRLPGGGTQVLASVPQPES